MAQTLSTNSKMNFGVIRQEAPCILLGKGHMDKQKWGESLNITLSALERMKQGSTESVNKESLVDIRDVKINENLPLTERVIEFIHQIQNPYVFLYKDTVVRINFSNTKATFEDRMRGYFEML